MIKTNEILKTISCKNKNCYVTADFTIKLIIRLNPYVRNLEDLFHENMFYICEQNQLE